jgi:hypothetical protein
LTNDKIAEYLCQSLLPKGQQQLEAWMTRPDIAEKENGDGTNTFHVY